MRTINETEQLGNETHENTNMREVIRKRRRSFFACLLTIILLAGSFYIPADAKGTSDDLPLNVNLQPGDMISWQNLGGESGEYTVRYIVPEDESAQLDHWVLTDYVKEDGVMKEITLTAVMSSGADTTGRVTEYLRTYGDGDDDTADHHHHKTAATVSAAKVEEKKVEVPPHEHTFKWVVTREATEDREGEESYKCECGHVEYRVPLSAEGVFIKNTIDKINKAPLNSTVKISTNRWLMFNTAVCDAFSKRPDLTMELSYLEGGHKGDRLTTTIPAGTDLHNYLDANGYEGFLYLKTQFDTVRTPQ